MRTASVIVIAALLVCVVLSFSLSVPSSVGPLSTAPSAKGPRCGGLC